MPAAPPPDRHSPRRLVNLLGALAIGIGDRLRAVTEGILANEGAGPAAVAVIGHYPGLSVRALSEILDMSHPGAVRLVDSLEARGLVGRARSQKDGRALQLTLTPAGHAMRDEMLGQREAEIAGLLWDLESADLRALEALVEQILARLPRQARECDTICRFCDQPACVPCPMDAVEARFAAIPV